MISAFLLTESFQKQAGNNDINNNCLLTETVYFPFTDMIVIISSIVAVSLASNVSTSPIR